MEHKDLVAALTDPKVRTMLRDAVSKGVLVAAIVIAILGFACALMTRQI